MACFRASNPVLRQIGRTCRVYKTWRDMIALPLWAIGCAFARSHRAGRGGHGAALARDRHSDFFAQVAASLLLVGVGWLYLERLDTQDRAEQRRNIEARLSALTAQALVCRIRTWPALRADAGEAVTESCEKALLCEARAGRGRAEPMWANVSIFSVTLLVGNLRPMTRAMRASRAACPQHRKRSVRSCRAGVAGP